MKKLIVFLVLAVGVAAAAKLLAPKMQHVDWEKRFERMPDDAPPKWMFRNISSIRENTDRIIDLLDENAPARTT